jgi:hypothetical protein
VPYQGEFASHRPVTRLVNNPRVTEMLSRCERIDHHGPAAPIIEGAAVAPSGWTPEWIIAIDGSVAPQAVSNGFPGAEVCYLTVAAVMVNVAKLRELDAQRPVHPREFRTTRLTGAMDCVLPGCNVVIRGEASAPASFRRALFEEMQAVRSTDDGETLLDTYEALLARKPRARAGSVSVQPCPYEQCDDGTGAPRAYEPRPGCTECACNRKLPWWSTDATRIYQGMNPVGPSGEMFGEVMSVWERLYVINIIRSMLARGWGSSFRRVAIVLDGPLAVQGHPAWLSAAITSELIELNREVRRVSGKDLLLLGVEKSGAFVEHFDLLDVDPITNAERFVPQTVLLPSNEYIRSNIVPGIKPWGIDTYFGRKFFYKTKQGARIVATVPILSEAQRDRNDVRPEQFPRLADTLSLLDSVVSSRYPNSVAPLVDAHSEAAIPLNMGKKVLEQLAREMMGGR